MTQLQYNRRNFLKRSSLSAMALALGADIVFSSNIPEGFVPVALAENQDFYQLYNKDKELTILTDRPWNVETPPHLLDDPVTPADKLFVRNNGRIPEKVDIDNWILSIEGESVKNSKKYSIKDLKTNFKNYTYQLTLECGGNGRSEFNPPATGAQWTYGAVGCPEWTGVRLKDVLNDAGIKPDAVYIGYYGADLHLSGDASKVTISRGVPMSKALEDESLIAWGMNGKDLPLINGYPLRLVFGGWPGSTSGKWLTKIVIRNKVHDGEKMGGSSYRVPCKPVAPGAKVTEDEMCIIEAMPVKSLITYPKSGAIIKKGRSLEIQGHAWAGDRFIASMYVSKDFGATWQKCNLKPPKNRNAWQQWNTIIDFPQEGYYEIWARATDDQNQMQPMVVPNWNPQGYLNNACHRIALKVA